ncbi:MAG: DNA polymerase IV [Elusimicrobia bacterium]|nr:DNA polymerase IV [Elusimicrobiota bacterium]
MAGPHAAARIVSHVDMDCFFAAVEEREDPSLKGRPVIVGADPRGGLGRGIVATCNYEARRFGVRSALPISIAFQRCPKGVFLRPRFPLYAQASRRVMQHLQFAADVFEAAGIDEAYLDMSSSGTYEAARERARALQAAVRDGEGLSCSIGVGPNKLVAKIGSDHRKPGGITVVIDRRVQEFLDPKSVGALRGVGPKTRERLAELGVETIRQLREAPAALLARELGRFGEPLGRQARGLDERPVDPARETKSTSREHTFEADTDDIQAVRGTLRACVRRVREDMLDEGFWARTLTVKVRFEGYETHSRQTTLRLPTASLAVLDSAALALATPFLESGRKFRLVGFGASKLCPPEELLPLEEPYV